MMKVGILQGCGQIIGSEETMADTQLLLVEVVSAMIYPSETTSPVIQVSTRLPTMRVKKLQ